MTSAGQIPSGTVTLLFTDVQGSTRLWEAEPSAMAIALRRHDEIMRAAIEAAGGYVFKTVGDAFCAAFWTPAAAVDAALAAQQQLGAEDWPTSVPISVRMGLHTGVCEERDQDYFGPAVNRAARLEAVAHGGQVLVSGATAELLSDRSSLRDLGLHRLKDLGRPEQVYQLEATFLQASFPPLASLDNPELPNNLPTLLSAFVGRDAELTAVRDMVTSARLVTLTGAGGSGKTRLALQAAAEQVGRSPDGVWLAELAPLTEGSQIPAAVAAALGIIEHGGAPLPATLIQALTAQDVLLVLDNCEHLVDEAAKFCDEVIRHCPKVRFLATSREPLGIDGERVYRVPSLSLPEASADAIEDITGSDAVRLFAERARSHQPSFQLDDSAAPLIATICRRLDGIPLALELAAARLSAMSLKQVTDRLDQRFRLLTGGARNAMPRQQTLQATVEWSFGLLTASERSTLMRLSVFAGGFDLEAAEQLCSTAEVDAFDVADLVGSLVDKSLLLADHSAESVRYHLLETIRQYSAQELLRAAGDDAVLDLRTRHAEYYREVADAVGPALAGPDQADCLRRLDAEWDNLRAALAHFAAEERDHDILRLATPLLRFAISRGHADFLKFTRPAVDRQEAQPSSLLASALMMVASLITLLLRTDAVQMAAARQYAERALEMARSVGDRRIEVAALAKLAESAIIDGNPVEGRALAREGTAIARDTGDVQLLGEILQLLGWVTDDLPERTRIHREGLDCARQCGDLLLQAGLLSHLFSHELHTGQIERGSRYLEESIRLADELGGDFVGHFLRCNLALVRLIQGRFAEAVPLVRTCLLTGRRLGPGVPGGELLFAAACCAAWQGDSERAARLHGAGDADIAASLKIRTINWSASEDELRAREQRRLRELMGEAAYEAAYRSGAQLSAHAAVDLALGRNRA